MNRFKRIATRGRLGKALNVLTFGYYPVNTGQPIVKIRFAFDKRSMVLVMAKKSITFGFVWRYMTFSFTQRSMAQVGWAKRTISFNLAQRSIAFDFIGNELG